jgi:TRAP-type C4-dicarboxylate transport system permease small subunit
VKKGKWEMDIKNWDLKISKVSYSIDKVAGWISYVGLTAIVLIIFVDVCGRYLLNKPLLGSIELVEQSMGILSGFAITCTVIKREHVTLDLVINRFTRRTQSIIERIFSFLGAGITIVLAYRIYLWALVDLKSDERTSVLQILTAPLTLMLALGLFLCGLTLLIQTFHPVALDGDADIKEGNVNEP